MKLEGYDNCHLTYCTNIHPGESWSEVRNNLFHYVTAIKKLVSPKTKFGVGLRLSSLAVEALRDTDAIQELQSLLVSEDLYVFTLNGFPYGKFHKERVKEKVYLPDWLQESRLHYTNLLADVLAAIMPNDAGMTGSISTVPGAFRDRIKGKGEVEQMTTLIISHVSHLAEIYEKTGRCISLALEPEPCCFLETIEQTVTFFNEHLFSRSSVLRLQKQTGKTFEKAEEALRRHLGICLDTCHAAVEFESPSDSISALKQAGIRISKLQISCGLRIENMNSEKKSLLYSYIDNVYLHQVVERGLDGLKKYLDLPDALKLFDNNGSEWRVHFHVPIFLSNLDHHSTTQFFLQEMLKLHRRNPISDHLEVETYTWDVLPEIYKRNTIEESISRELEWALANL